MRVKKFVIFYLLVASMNAVFSQSTTWSKQFADAIIDRYSNINHLTNKGWEYSNSIVLIGIEQVYYETGNEKYLAYIKKYIDSFIDANGNINFDASANNLDHLHPGWLCITLYEAYGDEKYKKAAENIRAEFDNQPRNTQGGFWHKQKYENQMWADGIYMAEPFLIRYGTVFNDLEYCANEATKQAILIADHAYDSTTHLMLHGWDETKEASWADAENGNSPEVWSRGMGWYCMALVDILDYLPESHANYNRLVEIMQGLAIGIKTYQDEEAGLWYQVVNKGELESNWHETSGSAMFVYSLRKAIRKHYIDSVTYMPVVEKGWEGLQTKITLDSKNQPIINDFVRGMGIKDSYDSYVAQQKVSTPDSRYSHGYCGILMAASEMEFPLPQYYTLNITKNGSGRVNLSEARDDYAEGSNITITATPNEEWTFVEWTGSINSTEASLSITMDSSMNIVANFEELVNLKDMVECYPYVLKYNRIGSELNIEIIDNAIFKNCYVVDVNGRICYENSSFLKGNNLQNNTINLSSFRPGVYLVNMHINNKTYTQGIVKY